MENETIKERFLGTIFGQAVGDALGLSTEFMSKQEVDRFYLLLSDKTRKL